MTRLERVWRHMRTKKDFWWPTHALMEELGINQRYVNSLMRRLVARGSVIGEGRTWARRYKATKKRPTDQRGRHPQAAINLAKGRAMGRVQEAMRHGKLCVPRTKDPLEKLLRRSWT